MCSKQSDRFFNLFDTSHDAASLQPPATFRRAGQQRGAMRSFQDHIGHTIDFHGYVVAEALEKIQQHLHMQPHSHICLFIHGKGHASGGVLKRAMLHYIAQHPRCYGYMQAPTHHGGSGATLVRFSKRK